MIKLLKKCLLNPIINSARPDFCEHVLDRALLERWTVKKTHEPFIVEFPIPHGCEADPHAYTSFATHQKAGFPAQYLICIPNGIAAGGGFVRLPTGEFLTESTWRMAYLLENDIYRARYRRHKLHLKGDYYYLDLLFSENYGHWFLDELPRLVPALPDLPSSTRFIVSDPLQDYKALSLASVGIERERLLPVKGYYETHCERLWFATGLGSTEWTSTSPAIFREIGNVLRERYKSTNGTAPERVYISREAAAFKRLVNEEQLLPVIRKHGFALARTENISFVQQVQIFSKAKAVLAPHGSGITNMLFCPPNAQLLELQDARFAPRHWYWKLASMLGHQYSTMTGSPTTFRNEGFTDFTDQDFMIHPDSLDKYLENSLSPADDKPKVQWWISG
jgi:capsular polysaccharide biosynthesis protein